MGGIASQTTSVEDLLLEDFPDCVLEAWAARKRFRQPHGGLGLEFVVSEVDGWSPGQRIRVAFLDGDDDLLSQIEGVLGEIQAVCNIVFVLRDADGHFLRWTPNDTKYSAEIRVSFDMRGYWSLVGRDSVDKNVGANDPNVGGAPNKRSLNLGGFASSLPARWRGTVLHEFLHALGFHHEHQNLNGPCQEDFRWEDDPEYVPTTDSRGVYVRDSVGRRPGIYTYLSGAPNGWNRAKVDRNLRAGADQGLRYGPFDRKSIMLYRFDSLFYNSQESECQPLGDGTSLSELDIEALQSMYPGGPSEIATYKEKKVKLLQQLAAPTSGAGLESVLPEASAEDEWTQRVRASLEAVSIPAMEAGRGETNVYQIGDGPGDKKGLTPNEHYLGVDAVSWFVNRQSGWFSQHTASGALEIQLADGRERYSTALGTFDLSNGNRRAPVFDRSVLPDRNYKSGSIVLSISLTSLNRDTQLTKMLKSAATASLGIVAGMVQTATLTGPQAILGAAGGSLVGGVQELLAGQGNGQEPLFGGTGIEKTIHPSNFIGPVMYLLFHRGTKLDQNRLKIATSGSTVIPLYEGNPLEDGAWILVRLRRSEKYSGVRDWFDSERSLRAELRSLLQDYASQTITKESAAAQLLPSSSGTQTAFDRFLALRSLINNDGVLTEAEAAKRVEELARAFTNARRTVNDAQDTNVPVPFSPAELEGVDVDPLVQESVRLLRKVRAKSQ